MYITPASTLTALAVLERPPQALVEYTADYAPSPGLVAKATARGLPPAAAEIACAVLTKAIACLDEASSMRRGYGRAKRLEQALEACHEPTATALRLAMVACPTDGRALLRLWREVCEPNERNAMIEMLMISENSN